MQARTGTGKTAAYGMPLLNSFFHQSTTQALILCPTRELALQVHRELERLGMYRGLNVDHEIHGGAPMSRPNRGTQGWSRYPILGTPRPDSSVEARNTERECAFLMKATRCLVFSLCRKSLIFLVTCQRLSQTLLFSATLPVEHSAHGRIPSD